MIAESVPYFELEKFFLLRARNPHIDFQMPYIWEALTALLTQTNLETLPLYLLGNSPRQMVILDASDDVDSLEYQRIKSRQLLVRREFAAATAVLLKLVELGSNNPTSLLDTRLLMIARALAGETIPADVIESIPDIIGDALFEQWFTTRFRYLITG